MLEEKFPLVQLSTGDLLRAAVAADTEAGKVAKAVMEAGDLVSDEIVLAILKDRLAGPDVSRGVILDVFPRTRAQATALDGLPEETGQKVNAAISLEVEDEAMIERVSGRYSAALAAKAITTDSSSRRLRAPAANAAASRLSAGPMTMPKPCARG